MLKQNAFSLSVDCQTNKRCQNMSREKGKGGGEINKFIRSRAKRDKEWHKIKTAIFIEEAKERDREIDKNQRLLEAKQKNR